MSRPASDGDDDALEDGFDRRRLVRWIAALAFGVPLVLELITFGGLIGRSLFSQETRTGTQPTSTSTQLSTGVGVGEDLLPETAADETVRRSEVRRGSEGSLTYVLRVEVENGTEDPVALVLNGVQLRNGRTIQGVSRTGTVPPEGVGAVTGAWRLPGESMPKGVIATALVDGEVVVERTVPIDRPPIRE